MFLDLPDLHVGPLDRGTDPRIRIRIQIREYHGSTTLGRGLSRTHLYCIGTVTPDTVLLWCKFIYAKISEWNVNKFGNRLYIYAPKVE
jgi:hypothetical protein